MKKDQGKKAVEKKAETPPKPPLKSPFGKAELADFRKLLLARREDLAGNVAKMENETLRRSRQDASGDLSSMPIHMADVGTDTFEQDFTLGLIESEEEELNSIEEALERIQENTYGICEECEKVIPRARLVALAHARLCLECKKKEEDGGGA